MDQSEALFLCFSFLYFRISYAMFRGFRSSSFTKIAYVDKAKVATCV
jgi:hypothetical protein